MNTAKLVALGAAFAIAVTNGYWWRRLRTVESGLETSHEWDQRAVTNDADRDVVDSRQMSLLNRAAEKADTTPEDLPETVEMLDEKRRELRTNVKKLRTEWVSSYWEALTRSSIETDRPHVVTIDLGRSTYDDARAFANHAQDADREVVVAVARSDDTFAVGVSEDLTERFGVSADDIATTIATEEDGNAGGTAAFAGGSVPDADRLCDRVDGYCPDLHSQPAG
ncbi:DHHA1 domain-containing protein [Halosimplex halobium]|uniref:DHHA1 domain-containing protein n=1 Tax=Halosimplex halobium TaxID=3396618 RepID=UPI003F575CE6